MKVTIKDVSQKAGVSITSVSQVLNGKDIRISEEKRQLILKVAEELNYSPNPFASKLKTNRSGMIGVIIPDISNPYFVEVAKGIIGKAREHNIDVLISDSNNKVENDIVNFEKLKNTGADGIILSSSGANNAELSELIHYASYNEKYPVVLLDRDNIDYNCNTVLIDNFNGGYLAGKHLIELGHEKIACILGPKDLNSTKNRLKGFEKALEDFGLTQDESLLAFGDYSLQSGYEASKYLDGKDFTAIFAFNDVMAFGTMKYYKERKVRIPEDLSIIGFDNISFAEYLDHSLTTVGQPIQKLGEKALELLMNAMESDDDAKTGIVLEPKLIQRSSTARNLRTQEEG